jgi:hypothetical protein
VIGYNPRMRRWRAAVVGGAVVLGTTAGCTSLLGDFQMGGPALDAGPDVAPDTSVPDTSAPDTSTPDASPPDTGVDTGPSCGVTGGVCCTQGAACQDSNAQCCSSQCIRTDNDPKNCGACSHSCQGGLCSGSSCGATLVGTVPGNDPGPILVSNQVVYWTNVHTPSSAAYFMDTSQTSPQPITIVQGADSQSYLTDIAFVQNEVYIADFGDILVYHGLLGSTSPSKYTSVIDRPKAIEYDPAAQQIAWVAGSSPRQAHVDFTSQSSLSTQQEAAADLAIADPYVYWADSANHNVRVGEMGQQSVADFSPAGSTNDYMVDVATDGSSVIWAVSNNGGTIYACPVGPSCATPVKLVAGENLGQNLGNEAIDGPNAIWVATVNGHASVRRCALTGCSLTPATVAIATNNSSMPGGITADATFIYFTASDGTNLYVFRVAK